MTKEKNPEKLFDLRTLEYSLSKGNISQKDYETFLKSLPDDEGNYEEVLMEEETPANHEADSADLAEPSTQEAS